MGSKFWPLFWGGSHHKQRVQIGDDWPRWIRLPKLPGSLSGRLEWEEYELQKFMCPRRGARWVFALVGTELTPEVCQEIYDCDEESETR